MTVWPDLWFGFHSRSLVDGLHERLTLMPRPYPPEFRQRAIALVRQGRQLKQTALDLGIHEVTLHSWFRQDDIDQDLRPGATTQESAELRAARQRIRQLEQELSILKRAQSWLDEAGGVDPKGRTR